ncbi:hypothetical protein DRJ17_00580 [Candidatus Woesearchaeota archaeon]|nr:MAG: hypothetical protein DRJ17_00580 [Candidatus Woesearchaeota archaeon]
MLKKVKKEEKPPKNVPSRKISSKKKEPEISELKGQECPMCKQKSLTLTEAERDIPYFGKVYIFSMTCSNCKYHKSDVEVAEKQQPCKYSLEISGDNDLNARVVKSSEATVKIPHIITIEPGPGSNGYITNVEGVLNRIKGIIESTRDVEEDKEAKKKASKLLKKINRAMFGQEKIKLIIEDPTGNSIIISEKAIKSKL